MKPDIRTLKQSNFLGDVSPRHETAQESANGSNPIDDRPRSVYEIVTRQMLEELKSDVAEVKGRINTLLWLVVGAVVLEFVMRVVK